MRSALYMELNLHVELHPNLTAPVARDLAGKVCHNRCGDTRRCALERQTSERIKSGPGQSCYLFGLCDGELRASAIDDAYAFSRLLG